MSSQRKTAYDQSPTIAVIIGVAMVSLFLTILWVAARPRMAHVYGTIRSIEFPFIWKFVPGSEHFMLDNLLRGFVPPTESIFLHSMYFGAFFFALIIVTMLLALIKLERFSITPHMEIHSPNGLPHDDVMKMYADTQPYVAFYQRFNLLEMSTVEGDARQPMTAMEVLEEAGAIKGVIEDYKSGRMPELDLDEDRLSQWLLSRMGPDNPFLLAFEKPRLERANEVAATIDKLPWTAVLILYPALWRRHAFMVEDTDGFDATIADVDDFIERIWKELNTISDQYGPQLRIGFDNDAQREMANSLYLEKNGKKKRKAKVKKGETPPPEGLISFHEMMTERGPKMEVVKEAYEGLKRVLTAHLGHDTGKFPVRQGKDGKMAFDKSAETASEKAYMAIAEKKLKEAAATISRETLFAHKYTYGLVGGALENVRRTGVMQPLLFNWLRFHDKPFWYFIHNLGMPTAVPENAASFEHFQAERVAKTAISVPFMRNCAAGLKIEAEKYLVEDELARIRATYGGRTIHDAVKRVFAAVDGNGPTPDGGVQADNADPAPANVSGAITGVLRDMDQEQADEAEIVEDPFDTEATQEPASSEQPTKLSKAKSGIGGFF